MAKCGRAAPASGAVDMDFGVSTRAKSCCASSTRRGTAMHDELPRPSYQTSIVWCLSTPTLKWKVLRAEVGRVSGAIEAFISASQHFARTSAGSVSVQSWVGGECKVFSRRRRLCRLVPCSDD